MMSVILCSDLIFESLTTRSSAEVFLFTTAVLLCIVERLRQFIFLKTRQDFTISFIHGWFIKCGC